MTRSHLRFLRNEVIEDVTAQRIREYESKHSVNVQLPVPIEEIVEQVLGLDFDWDVIEEQPGQIPTHPLFRSYDLQTNKSPTIHRPWEI